MVNSTKITLDEFKSLFDLDEECVVPKETLVKYNKQIKGAYLLYLEVKDIRKVKFKNVDGTPLQADIEWYSHGFQSFVDTLGSRSMFHVSYLDKNKKSVPFWTYTKYKTEESTKYKNSAYRLFLCILSKLKYKYMKYGFDLEYRDFATTDDGSYRSHPNQAIWWDGLNFEPLFYFDCNGCLREISSYSIIKTICNREDIWVGPILPPIKKVVASLAKKQLKTG